MDATCHIARRTVGWSRMAAKGFLGSRDRYWRAELGRVLWQRRGLGLANEQADALHFAFIGDLGR